MKLTLPIEFAASESSPNRLKEIKKVALGLCFYCGLELLFFTIAAISIWFIWMTVQHALRMPSVQNTYLYDPNEVKYLVIVIGGIKRKLVVKKFLRRYKIICH
jgi:hypothetical protein